MHAATPHCTMRESFLKERKGSFMVAAAAAASAALAAAAAAAL